MSGLATVTDENDNVIAYKDRHDIQPGEYMRISTLWIENSKGEVLIARRSPIKIVNPNKWGPAAAGTVEENETYESNVYKEAKEEIGLSGVKFKKYKKLTWLYKDGYGRHSMVFTAVVDRQIKDFTLQPEEVAEIKWITKPDLFEDIRKHPDKYVGNAHLWEENFK